MAGTLTVDTLKASTGVLATQNGMTGVCKAWVQFNGSTAAINASFNVGSITKGGTGVYTVNFTTPMSSAYYSTQICSDATSTNYVSNRTSTNGNATGSTLISHYESASLTDATNMYVAIFAA